MKKTQQNQKANISLVCSIIGIISLILLSFMDVSVFFLEIPLLLSVLGIVFGKMSINTVKEDGNSKPLDKAGFILGIIGLILTIIAICLYFIIFNAYINQFVQLMRNSGF